MSEDQIIDCLQRQDSPVGPSPRQAKYLRIKERLQQAVKQSSPGTRLPPMRKLASCFGVTVPPVQRAVSELVREKVLATRAGSGTFVFDPQTQPLRQNTDFLASALKQISMGVISSSPNMMDFWQQAIARFEAVNPRIAVRLKPIADIASRNEKLALDIIERPTHFWIQKQDCESHDERNIPLLNLEPFLGTAATESTASGSPFLTPIHTNIQCLYYDPDLLQKLGLAPPAYHNFEEQYSYLTTCLDAMEHENDAKTFMICYQQPSKMLGNLNQTIISWIQNPTATVPHHEQQRVVRALDQLITLKRRILKLQRTIWHKDVDDFSLPGMTFFSSFNYNYQYLRQQYLPVRRGVHPFFSADDHIPGILSCGGINRNTPNPVECVRFLEHLRTPAMQQELTTNVALPQSLWQQDSHITPPAPFNSAGWQQSWNQVQVKQNNSPLELYIRDSIINDELWQAIFTDRSADEVLNSVLNFGKAYLQHSVTGP